MRSKLEPVTDPTDDAVIREYWRKEGWKDEKDTIFRAGYVAATIDTHVLLIFVCLLSVRQGYPLLLLVDLGADGLR